MKIDIKRMGEIKGQIKINESMRNHTTFRVGGTADILILPKDIEDVQNVVKYAKSEGIPCYVIGNGSNLLVSDKGIRGIVIKICKVLNEIIISENTVTVGAGCLLPSLAKETMRHGLKGLEHVVGIPGAVGGGVRMNAGSGGHELSEVVEKVTILTSEGAIGELYKSQIGFGYRYSFFQETKDIILQVILRLQSGATEDIRKTMDDILKKRKEKFPLSYPNAGSVFKRKGDYSPGKLIEDAGCKGMTRGDAEVSQLHANFIINKGNAAANDILFLIKDIQDAVFAKFNVLLEPEIIFLEE
ncbi:MAG: UDP-N-acetylmuramate dehydrogenase [bacterium]